MLISRALVVVGACLVSGFAVGCATAVDDAGGFGGAFDGSPRDARTIDGGVGEDVSNGGDTKRGDSIATGIDTREGADTGGGGGEDTFVPPDDTYVPPDDTFVPPDDTYVPPTGGPCDWCLDPASSCTATDEDIACFESCVVFGGHYDCRWDKSASPNCLCTD